MANDLLALFKKDKSRFEGKKEALKNIADRINQSIFQAIQTGSNDLAQKIAGIFIDEVIKKSITY